MSTVILNILDLDSDCPLFLPHQWTGSTHLWRLLKHGAETSESLGSCEIPEDLAEELLRVHASAATPELLLMGAALSWAAGRAVRVVLPPLQFVAQYLGEGHTMCLSTYYVLFVTHFLIN